MKIKYLFCIVFCFGAVKAAKAQSGNNLSVLEKQLCFIQDTLSALRQNYPYTDDDYCDSLQHRFSIVLEELCRADKEMIFLSGNQQTDYLSISYRYAKDNIDTRLFISGNLTFPRIVYVETQEEILKPVPVRDKDGTEYVGGEIEVYKLERSKKGIKFISSGKDGHL